MRVENPQLLERMAHRARCEVDGCQNPGDHRHHVESRGQSDSKRLDCSINLCSVCHVHHAQTHGGHIARAEFEKIIARRELTFAPCVRAVVHLLVRSPKESTALELIAEAVRCEFSEMSLALLRKALLEAGIE